MKIVLGLSAVAFQAQETAVIADPLPTETTVTQALIATPLPVVTYVAPAPVYTTDLDIALAASNWPSWAYGMVKVIVYCESRGQTTARNGPYKGLMQIDETLHGYVPDDAVGQLNAGYIVYLKQGFQAWACA